MDNPPKIDESDAEELRRRMQLLRAHLDEDFHQVGQKVRDRTNWRYYVKQHPWLAAGAAALVGFTLVPRRINKVVPDMETITRLAEQEKLVIAPKSKATKTAGLGAQLFTLAATGVSRAAMGYLTGKAGEISGKAATANDQNKQENLSRASYSRPK